MNINQQTALIQECAAGKPLSQKVLFMTYSKELFATCKRYINNDQEAKDVLQDSFIRIFKYAHTFNPAGGNLKAWLKTICIREALRHLRKTKSNISLEEIQNLPLVSPQAIQNLDTEQLLKLISSLPKKQRTVFNLYVIEGYSHQEIAHMLNLKASCSRSILSRAKKILKEKVLQIDIDLSDYNFKMAV